MNEILANVNTIGTLFFIVLAIAVVCFISLFTVSQQRVAVIERFGKFNRLASAGLNFKIPFIETIRQYADLQIVQLNVQTNTKTKDNVTLEIITSVQIKINTDNQNNIYNAIYQLSNPNEQIRSYVFDIVRAKVPSMTLDNVYENKDVIAQEIESSLASQMAAFGYTVVKSLVTDVRPDQRVLDAMNQINEQARLRDAAQSKAEADKIILVKKAEAESEAMKLSGKGIADQRKEIINGLKDSVAELRDVLGHNVKATEVMQLVLITQYFDALKEIGANSKTNTLLLPHTPSGMQSLVEQMLSADLTSHASDGSK
jgi:regulator of protease activity HflC (stomatin/prohibitin superfamily)